MADDVKPGDSIPAKLLRVFDGLIEVKVVTVVGNVTVDISNDDGHTSTAVNTTTPTDALVTIFNLIDGDVTNVIAPALKDDASIRAFHTAQVEKSLQVLPGNLEALVKLGKSLFDEFK